MMRAILGIDPGNEGAAAFLSPDGVLLGVVDIPCIADGVQCRRTVNAPLLADLIRQRDPSHAFVELIGARPTDAKAAAFAFGRCRGVIEGILGALGVPAKMMPVVSWRRAVGLPTGATKDQARGEAIRRWPAQAAMFARKRDDGRAEACLIALAGILRGRQ